MPIVIDKDIPAYKILTGERIFVMDKERAFSQEIRPIEIAILNLMPTKETTETQFMRLLSNSPLQVNITLIRTSSYNPTHTDQNHLDRFYKSFEEVRQHKFDGMMKKLRIGANLKKFWTGRKPTLHPRFLSAGARKRRCITFTR